MHDFEHDREIIVKENEEAAIVVWCNTQQPVFRNHIYDLGASRIDDAIWVTHFKNKRDGAYYWGHYDMTLEEALVDAKIRNL